MTDQRTIDPALCPGHDTYIATIRKANNTLEIREWCRHCVWWQGGWSHKKLETHYGLRPEQLPIERDYLDWANPCAYKGCDNPGSEIHHWAPYAVFGTDADNWPTGPLCRHHHHEWHHTTRLGIGGIT